MPYLGRREVHQKSHVDMKLARNQKSMAPDMHKDVSGPQVWGEAFVGQQPLETLVEARVPLFLFGRCYLCTSGSGS